MLDKHLYFIIDLYNFYWFLYKREVSLKMEKQDRTLISLNKWRIYYQSFKILMYALTILPFPLFLFTLQLGQINNQQMSQLELNQSSLYMSNVKQPLTTSIKITLSLSHFHSLSHLNLGFMKKKENPFSSSIPFSLLFSQSNVLFHLCHCRSSLSMFASLSYINFLFSFIFSVPPLSSLKLYIVAIMFPPYLQPAQTQWWRKPISYEMVATMADLFSSCEPSVGSHCCWWTCRYLQIICYKWTLKTNGTFFLIVRFNLQKTKPTQHNVRQLKGLVLVPNLLACYSPKCWCKP